MLMERPTVSPFLSLLVIVWFESLVGSRFWLFFGTAAAATSCVFDEISPKRPDRTASTSCPPQPNWSSHIWLQLKLQLQGTSLNTLQQARRATGRPRGSLLLVVSQHMATSRYPTRVQT